MWISRRDYDGLNKQLSTAEAAVARHEAKLEYVETENEVLKADIRRMQKLLSDLAERPRLDTIKNLSDIFSEDDSQPTVYVSEADPDPDDVLEKMSSGDPTRD